jgi:hypothetical protein
VADELAYLAALKSKHKAQVVDPALKAASVSDASAKQ